MSLLTLVRHAQASFHADHYDRLSELGQRQAGHLAESWIRAEREVDELYVGPRERQRHTAELVAVRYHQAGLPFPAATVLPELDEYDLGGLLMRLAPELARQDAKFASLWEFVGRGRTDPEWGRKFQQMFEALTLHWLGTDTVMEGLESWVNFRDRVQRGLHNIVNRPGQGRRVVAFTSGGFIGTAMQLLLGAPNRVALELNWRIRNAAVTEFVFSGQRITLDVFNSVAHFAEPELVTYR